LLPRRALPRFQAPGLARASAVLGDAAGGSVSAFAVCSAHENMGHPIQSLEQRVSVQAVTEISFGWSVTLSAAFTWEVIMQSLIVGVLASVWCEVAVLRSPGWVTFYPSER
jgi:hypothetical protein